MVTHQRRLGGVVSYLRSTAAGGWLGPALRRGGVDTGRAAGAMGPRSGGVVSCARPCARACARTRKGPRPHCGTGGRGGVPYGRGVQPWGAGVMPRAWSAAAHATAARAVAASRLGGVVSWLAMANARAPSITPHATRRAAARVTICAPATTPPGPGRGVRGGGGAPRPRAPPGRPVRFASAPPKGCPVHRRTPRRTRRRRRDPRAARTRAGEHSRVTPRGHGRADGGPGRPSFGAPCAAAGIFPRAAAGGAVGRRHGPREPHAAAVVGIDGDRGHPFTPAARAVTSASAAAARLCCVPCTGNPTA